MKKNIVIAVIAASIAMSTLAGCGKSTTENPTEVTTEASTEEDVDLEVDKEPTVIHLGGDNAKKNETEESSEAETIIDTEVVEAINTMYVTGTQVNIRSLPHVDGKILGTAVYGDTAQVRGESLQGWYKVTVNGVEGYMSGDYLSEDKPVTETAKTDTPAPTTTTPVKKTTSSQTTATNGSTYTSEITGLQIASSIQNQRPIAVMIDNEKTALPHYGVGEADVVYEMVNSTANNRITRLMCVYKDWQNIDMIGSIRSTRSTNPMLAAEWNAVLIHDGGPYYINAYLNQSWARHLSGGFSRVNNGKATEFTEYVKKGELAARMKKAGYSTTYDSARNSDTTHFNIGSNKLTEGTSATNVSLPFPHNSSKLKYNTSTGTYDYYEYGSVHTDAEDGQVATFTNVILQNVDMVQLDKNGYMIYNVIGEGSGYYLTNGKAVPVIWRKTSETDITRYYDANGKEITINAGKTYIGLVPSDSWSSLSIS